MTSQQILFFSTVDIMENKIEQILSTLNRKNIDDLINIESDCNENCCKRTILSLVCEYGSYYDLKKVLEFNPDLELINAGKTAIFYIGNKHFHTLDDLLKLQLLIEQKVDCTVTTPSNETVLYNLVCDLYYYYANQYTLRMIELLVDNGCAINAQTECDKLTALMIAASADEFDVVSKLIQLGADIHLRDSHDTKVLDQIEDYWKGNNSKKENANLIRDLLTISSF